METNEKLIKIVTRMNRAINDFFRIYPSLDDDTKKFISSYYLMRYIRVHTCKSIS